MPTILKRYSVDLLALLAIAMVIGIFFFRFFWPQLSLIVTPDFGRSDAWHRSYSLMHMLSTALRRGSLPTWTPLIGNGYPLDGEVMGTYYPITFLLFRLFDTPLAYNLLIVISMLIFGAGMYIWVRGLGISPLPSLLPSIILPISGIVIPRLEHIMIIQSLSLLPWIMIITHQLIRKADRKTVLLLGIIIGLQILAAFPQVTFITLLLSSSYYLLSLWRHAHVWKRLLLYGCSLLLSFGIGAIQLFPSFELSRNSTISNGFDPTAASYFAFPPKHLITFIDPYALGDPRQGTYPSFVKFGGSIFWENSSFVGIAPLLLFGMTLIALIRGSFDPKQRRSISIMLWILGIAFLLMLGYHSPLHIIYSFWPFSNFRTPSRFLWVFVFALLTISAYGAHALWHSKKNRRLVRIVLILTVIANTIHVAWVWRDYHAVVPVSQWHKPPDAISYIKTNSRVYTYGFAHSYFKEYTTNGYLSLSQYDFYRNLLAPNSNVIWNVPHTNSYAGLDLRRSSIMDDLLTKSISVDDSLTIATVSAIGTKLIDMNSVGTIITTVPFVPIHTLKKVKELSRNNETITIYDNPDVLPRVYLSRDTRIAKSLREANEALEADDFTPGTSILVEEQLPLGSESENQETATIINESATRIRIATSSMKTPTMLVLADTYYPEWRATIDGAYTRIYPVNINQRGVIVPPGDHTVEFGYNSEYYRRGRSIGVASIIIILFLMVYPQALVAYGTGHKATG